MSIVQLFSQRSRPAGSGNDRLIPVQFVAYRCWWELSKIRLASSATDLRDEDRDGIPKSWGRERGESGRERGGGGRESKQRERERERARKLYFTRIVV